MRSKKTHNIPKRILIIRLSAMGDVLLTTPLLRILKKHYQKMDIHFCVKKQFAPLIETNPSVQSVISFSPGGGLKELRRILNLIRQSRYDAIIDLQVNFRSWLLRRFSGVRRKIRYHPQRWRRFLLVHFRMNRYKNNVPIPLRYIRALKSWGVEDDGEGLDLVVASPARKSILSILKEAGVKKKNRLIVLAPGAGRGTKRWPADKFTEVGNYFHQKGMRVCIVGGNGDETVCDRIHRDMLFPVMNFVSKFSLHETAALIAESDILISNDTGVMHIGCALRKPVVALFGPTTHHLGFSPFRTQAKVIERDLDCRPCSYHGTETCPKGHFRCMVDISSSQVIQAAEKLLKDSKQ
ncbi:lipopolysaccharide heptosyltransferase II [bacterium]